MGTTATPTPAQPRLPAPTVCATIKYIFQLRDIFCAVIAQFSYCHSVYSKQNKIQTVEFQFGNSETMMPILKQQIRRK